MDHKQVMIWHLKWTNDLENALREGHPVNPKDLGRDDLCDVGKWLKGDGAQYSDLPEFQEFEALHAAFHKKVCEAAKRAQNENDPDALHEFDVGGECDDRSLDLAQKSHDLFAAIAARENEKA